MAVVPPDEPIVMVWRQLLKLNRTGCVFQCHVPEAGLNWRTPSKEQLPPVYALADWRLKRLASVMPVSTPEVITIASVSEAAVASALSR
jgi:hypothetical protein